MSQARWNAGKRRSRPVNVQTWIDALSEMDARRSFTPSLEMHKNTNGVYEYVPHTVHGTDRGICEPYDSYVTVNDCDEYMRINTRRV